MMPNMTRHAMSHRRHRTGPALLLAVSVLAGVGCGGSADTNTSDAAVAEAPSGLAAKLTAEGLPCTLQYPGLRDDLTAAELSICTVAGDQAYLRVWSRPEEVATFLASPEAQTGTVAVGANWTVSLTDRGTAQQVATALGGLVPSNPPATTM
jgi:hypothetical protein